MNDLEVNKMESTQDSDISTALETTGFDLSAGNTWIYPENYPVREYQYNIVKKALFYNTLVCLPTGLGKTFVAAVVMYNFWRWYPRGKIVFLAPTKPLVAQQIDACYNVMGIPSIESIELTGNVNHKARQIAWFKKRVFFATPQVFHNDLENNIIPSEFIKCVVIDEAHKALGKHSYCECIRILNEKNRYFRILALSATPGNKIANVHQVVQNLCISHIELRDETSLDIMPYINQRKTDIILVPLGKELEKFKDQYINIMDRHVKFLIKCNVISGQTANISKGKIFMILREFQKTPNQSGNNQIKTTLNILLTMYHAYELMIRHGLRAFYKFYQNHSDKYWMNSEIQLQKLITEIQTYLGPFPDPQLFIHENIPEIPDNLVFGHNKFLKLRELLLHHFKMASSSGKDTRAIVFVEYRDIVSEVYILLLQAKPLIRPQMFVGRSEQKQKSQIKAIEDFRQNRVNVLISTSIGEEGLDVGEVDLIICFDVSQKSPTRLVQRMGRTGRKRDGHIIVLVTNGKEHEALKSTMARRESLNSKILNTSNICSSLYQENPRMIPDLCNPECRKMHIHIKPKTPVKKGTKSKKADNKKSNETSTKKTKTPKQSSIDGIKNTNQSSLSKFLVNTKFVNNNDDDDYNNDDNDFVEIVKPTIIETTTLNNKTNLIKASNVKLLTCDNEAVDFLTLCAMKKSEEEMKPKKPKVDTTYVSLTEPITNFVDFIIPSLDILDNLADYLSNIKIDLSLPKEPSQNDYDDDDNFWYNDQYNIVSPVNIGINECANISESKFEDLLNESTDSDDIADDENNINNQDTNVNIVEHSTTETVINTKCSDKSDNLNFSNTNSSVPMDGEVSFFEDIFNDSFDSIENDCNTDDVENNQLKMSDSNNDSSKITTSNKIQEKTNNSTLPKMLIKEQPKEELSKHCESMYPINQAINEIALINSKENLQPVLTEVKDTLQYVAQKSEYASTSNKLLIQSNIQMSDYESEDDIFASDLEENLKINAPDNESRNETNPKNETFPNSEQSIDKKLKSIGYNQFEVDDFEWNNDFEVSSVSAANSKYFNLNSTKASVKNTDDAVVSSFANDIMGDDTDSGEWISFQPNSKSEEPLKDKSIKLAKKLSTIKHSFSNSISVDDQNDSENDFVISKNDIEKLNQLETNYFSEQKNRNCDTSIPSSSYCKDKTLNKFDTQKMTLSKLSSFKASDKYLKSNFNKTSQNSQSKYMKSSRDSSYKNKSKSKMRSQCEYIDYEAAVSFDSSSSESSGADEDLQDFVSYTQYAQDEDIHALYLQASKSPIKKPNAFVFKEPKVSTEIIDIYSQPCPEINETYLEDSFCVNNDQDDSVDESKHVHGYSILEEAEKILENRKRKRIKSDRSENSVWKNRKKRKKNKVINISSNNSSEDETEKLRTEIQNESMMLKGLRP